MSGIPMAGIDPQTVVNLKPHYEPVLRQHIEQTFWEGYQAGKQGQDSPPANKKMIPTPRGSLESWMPLHHLTSLYQAWYRLVKWCKGIQDSREPRGVGIIFLLAGGLSCPCLPA